MAATNAASDFPRSASCFADLYFWCASTIVDFNAEGVCFLPSDPIGLESGEFILGAFGLPCVDDGVVGGRLLDLGSGFAGLEGDSELDVRFPEAIGAAFLENLPLSASEFSADLATESADGAEAGGGDACSLFLGGGDSVEVGFGQPAGRITTAMKTQRTEKQRIETQRTKNTSNRCLRRRA